MPIAACPMCYVIRYVYYPLKTAGDGLPRVPYSRRLVALPFTPCPCGVRQRIGRADEFSLVVGNSAGRDRQDLPKYDWTAAHWTAGGEAHIQASCLYLHAHITVKLICIVDVRITTHTKCFTTGCLEP